MMKTVVDAKTDKVDGFSCLGIEGGEVMRVVPMAKMGGLEWMNLRDAVFAHPTLAEG